MKLLQWLTGLVLACVATPVLGGPPYLTDDPVPTDTGHWEIYAFTAGEGRGSTFDGDGGFDLNYGAAEGVQVTATLPVGFSHASHGGWRSGIGDVELGIKYRLFRDETRGLSVAVFPRVILPTAAHVPGARARFLLPVWLGKDFGGGTDMFGGGGYMINPGPGNRNFWQGAVALTQTVGKTISVGAEVTGQGADRIGGTAQIRAGVGSIVQLSSHWALLLSAGPTWADHTTSYHGYAAVGLSF